MVHPALCLSAILVQTLLFQGPVRFSALCQPDSPAPASAAEERARALQTGPYSFEWASRESHPEVVASYDPSGLVPKR